MLLSSLFDDEQMLRLHRIDRKRSSTQLRMVGGSKRFRLDSCEVQSLWTRPARVSYIPGYFTGK